MRNIPNNVTLRQLRAFQAVADDASFVAAARRLCITQSALSGTIKQLESAIGLRLFDRTTRAVSLTREGVAFLEDVRMALGSLEQGLQRMSEISALSRGEVSIAAAPSALATLVLPCVGELASAHPGIRITLREEGADAIARCVRERDVDFAIGATPAASDTLRCDALLEDQLGVVGLGKEPLLQAQRFSASAWAGVRVIGLTLDTAIGRMVDAEADFPESARAPAVRLSNTLLMPEAIRAGLGVGIIPALVAQHPAFRGLAFRPITTPRVTRSIGIMRDPRRGLSPAAAIFHDAILRWVTRLPNARGVVMRVKAPLSERLSGAPSQ